MSTKGSLALITATTMHASNLVKIHGNFGKKPVSGGKIKTPFTKKKKIWLTEQYQTGTSCYKISKNPNWLF